MHLTIIKDLSNDIDHLLPFRRFCIAGGEITLPEFVEDVIEILSFAKEMGYFTEIVTNGFAFARGHFQNLIEVLDGMEVSVSPFHINTLGVNYYKKVLKTLKELRSKINILLRYQSTRKFTLSYLYNKLWPEIESMIVVSSPVSRIGRAKKIIDEEDLWMGETRKLAGGCWKNLNITVTSEGYVTPCCAGSEVTTYLKYGNIRKDKAKNIVKIMAEDPYLYVLTRYPEKIIEVLQEHLPEKSGCFCEICVLLNSDPELYKMAKGFVDAVVKEVQKCSRA
ncbi:SPASM domain-containing protein [Archaeoglobus sp.]|uniref:SPASM domain-containing protein n=1 Tax=Archaeoglobus sp. TaxID=1872626 RepID=UPI0024ABE928|nr:SPASM domain-containing protein [Archaeoglobus sp.]MDI3498864.1 hypothetical protein [Archaeoglobus sp.]